MKKRTEARVTKSLLVDLSRKGLQQMGVTVNISRRGMFIATTGVLRRRSKLRILVAAADDIYSLTGQVVWTKRDALPDVSTPVGLGIRISRSTPGYYKLIAALKKSRQEFREG